MDIKQYFPYDTIRKPQQYILDELENAYRQNKRYIIIEAGTGVGKSAIAKTISAFEKKSYVLTATKQLQDQYVTDFYNMNTKTIKGKANYECLQDEDLDCENGPCKYNKKKYKQCLKDCPYYQARTAALASEMCVTSYAFFLQMAKMIQKSKTSTANGGKRPVIVVDEAHLIEDQLLQFSQFTLDGDKLEEKYELLADMEWQEQNNFLKSRIEREQEAMEEAKQADKPYSSYDAHIEWIKTIANCLMKKKASTDKQLEQYSTQDNRNKTVQQLEDAQDIKKLNKMSHSLENLLTRIDNFLTSEASNWFVTVEGESKLVIQPMSVNNLFSELIDYYATHKVVFLSATILDVNTFCNDIGISTNDVYYIKADSTFNPRRSPIVYKPVGSLNYNKLKLTMPYIYQEIKNILKIHKNQKGIIHTGSYSVLRMIANNVHSKRLEYRMAGNDFNTTNETMVNQHHLSDKPVVLMSPSLMTGVDLADEDARFQIVVKLPWISMADKRVKYKMEMDKSWYACKMLRNLVQECGRSTRNENDWSVTYILDAGFETSARYNKNILPKQFYRRIVYDYNFDLEKFYSLL